MGLGEVGFGGVGWVGVCHAGGRVGGCGREGGMAGERLAGWVGSWSGCVGRGVLHGWVAVSDG